VHASLSNRAVCFMPLWKAQHGAVVSEAPRESRNQQSGRIIGSHLRMKDPLRLPTTQVALQRNSKSPTSLLSSHFDTHIYLSQKHISFQRYRHICSYYQQRSHILLQPQAPADLPTIITRPHRRLNTSQPFTRCRQHYLAPSPRSPSIE
jgi:hypothetical protein